MLLGSSAGWGILRLILVRAGYESWPLSIVMVNRILNLAAELPLADALRRVDEYLQKGEPITSDRLGSSNIVGREQRLTD